MTSSPVPPSDPGASTAAHSVTVVGTGLQFEVGPGERLLGAARRAGVWLPFECGWGTCGTCKVTLVDGDVDQLFPEAPAITPRDERRGRILACQTTARTDLTIKALKVGPVEERPTRDHTAELVAFEEVGPQIRRFRFLLDEPARYRAGQYAILVLEPHLRRCYSMSGHPGNDVVEFVAKRYDGRPGSERLFELEPGDRIPIELPYGDMWLRPGERPVVLTAGGTGVSAILALLRELVAAGSTRPVRVFYGANTEADLACWDEIRQLVGKLPDAVAHPVLLRPGTDWTGHTGVVTDSLARELHAIDDPDHYFAGPPVMVDAVTALLRERGVELDRLYFDRFG